MIRRLLKKALAILLTIALTALMLSMLPREKDVDQLWRSEGERTEQNKGGNQ